MPICMRPCYGGHCSKAPLALLTDIHWSVPRPLSIAEQQLQADLDVADLARKETASKWPGLRCGSGYGVGTRTGYGLTVHTQAKQHEKHECSTARCEWLLLLKFACFLARVRGLLVLRVCMLYAFVGHFIAT
eukprot:scaffold80571_cov22-Tisochrysis_lutea.AAC.1